MGRNRARPGSWTTVRKVDIELPNRARPPTIPSRPTTDTLTDVPSGKVTSLQMTHESGKYSPLTPSSSAERSCCALSSTSEEWPSSAVRDSAPSASQMALLPSGGNISPNALVISGTLRKKRYGPLCATIRTLHKLPPTVRGVTTRRYAAAPSPTSPGEGRTIPAAAPYASRGPPSRTPASSAPCYP